MRYANLWYAVRLHLMLASNLNALVPAWGLLTLMHGVHGVMQESACLSRQFTLLAHVLTMHPRVDPAQNMTKYLSLWEI